MAVVVKGLNIRRGMASLQGYTISRVHLCRCSHGKFSWRAPSNSVVSLLVRGKSVREASGLEMAFRMDLGLDV